MLSESVSAVAHQLQAVPLVAPHHFYADWTFWQSAVALTALVLSQFPPLITYFRPGRLKADLASKIFITHTYGNPNINLLVGLRNVGAKEVRVHSLWMIVKRAGGESFRLDAHNFENPGDLKPYLLVPFTIAPRENWVRHYLFYQDFDRQTDKEIRSNKLEVSRQVRERRAKLPPNSPELVSVDDQHWMPFKTIFNRLFRWEAGEYEIELHIETEQARASLLKKFRFVLFEGDTELLKDHVLEYPTGGGGILWTGERSLGVFLTIKDAA